MVDNITTVSRAKVGKYFGVLQEADMIRLHRAIVVFFSELLRHGKRIERPSDSMA
jgi:hypothetical protein